MSSCASLKNTVINDNGIKLSESNLTLLNGKYVRKPINDDYERKGLILDEDKDLFHFFFGNTYSSFFCSSCKDGGDFIELEVLNKEKILVSFPYVNHSGKKTVKSKILKGKLQNGYFEFNRNAMLMPFGLLNLYANSKHRIKLSNENDLIFDYVQVTSGTVYVIFPMCNKIEINNIRFKRIEK